MVYWLNLVNSGNTKAFICKKILKKLEYFFKIITFLIINKSIYAFLVRCINIEPFLKKVIYIIKVLIFLSNVALANFFLIIILLVKL